MQFRLLACIAILFAYPSLAHAHGIETVEVKTTASSLSGRVLVQMTDERMQDADVSWCNRGFKSCSHIAVTDADGGFRLHKRAIPGFRYYLQVTYAGMNPQWLTIRIRPGAPRLVVHLTVAT